MDALKAKLRILWLAYAEDLLLGLGVFVLVAIAFFAGRLSANGFLETQQRTIVLERVTAVPGGISTQAGEGAPSPSDPTEGNHAEAEEMFVASKKGQRYHLLQCPGAQQIAEENKIYFASKEEAESAGYSPARNCPGL